MAIHAKLNGQLIGGKILEEGGNYWLFHAMDEKNPKSIANSDPKNQVFDGDNAVDNAISWQESNRKK